MEDEQRFFEHNLEADDTALPDLSSLNSMYWGWCMLDESMKSKWRVSDGVAGMAIVSAICQKITLTNNNVWHERGVSCTEILQKLPIEVLLIQFVFHADDSCVESKEGGNFL